MKRTKITTPTPPLSNAHQANSRLLTVDGAHAAAGAWRAEAQGAPPAGVAAEADRWMAQPLRCHPRRLDKITTGSIANTPLHDHNRTHRRSGQDF